VSPLELVRVRWDAPDGPAERATRVGARVAGLGITTLAAAERLRRLRASNLRDGARERALVLRDVARRALHLHGVELTVQGALPLGAALLASNHVSWLDPLVVASLLPCVPISKLDVSGWPVVGSLARELGVVFTERGNPHSGLRVLRTAEVASSREALRLVRALAGVNLVGMDVVEVCPPHDHADLTSHLAAHVLFEGLALAALATARATPGTGGAPAP
jgi:hypothetical protein